MSSINVKLTPLVRAIASVKLHESNARVHGERNIKAIADSLATFGQQKPIVVASDDVVVAGNGTLQAALRLGWTEIACVTLDVPSTDVKARGFAIADNRSQDLSSFDRNLLLDEFAKLRAINVDIGTLGFDVDDLSRLGRVTNFSDYELEDARNAVREDRQRAEAAAASNVDDPGPSNPPIDPVSKAGDLWILGDHRILCGDSTKTEDIARVMDGDKATLLSTDPPYCVDYTGNDRPIHDGKPSGKDWSHVYREVDIEDFGTFLDSVFRATLPHVKDDAAIYVWHAHVQQPVIAATFENHGLLLHQVLVWVKPTATFGHCYYRWRHEPCAFGWKRGHKPVHGFGQMETVWEVDWEGKSRVVGNEHPTQKPTRLFEIPMEQHTATGALVLEPFSGSGSQIIAAEKIGRRCRAIELSPAFVDVAVRRWEKATGKKAVLSPT